MLRKTLIQVLCIGITCTLFSTLGFAQADPLVGKWKTIDDRSSYSRADVEIRKKADGSYEGIITQTRSLPGAEKMEICHTCPGEFNNRAFIGLPFIWNFKQNPNNPKEFINGSILDPIGGKIYQGKARLSGSDRHLTIRGSEGSSSIGRSVTWIKY